VILEVLSGPHSIQWLVNLVELMDACLLIQCGSKLEVEILENRNRFHVGSTRNCCMLLKAEKERTVASLTCCIRTLNMEKNCE
jgi:hypothetical protein